MSSQSADYGSREGEKTVGTLLGDRKWTLLAGKGPDYGCLRMPTGAFGLNSVLKWDSSKIFEQR